MFTRPIEKELKDLLVYAENVGLPKSDIISAREALEYFEYELCIDTLIEQLNEYEIPINDIAYRRFIRAVELVGKNEKDYPFLKSLVK